jgi:hypothetical protein
MGDVDTLTYGAAACAPFDRPDDARRWFQMIAEQMRNVPEDPSFDEAVEAIVKGADAVGLAWAAATLVEYLPAMTTDPLAVLRELGDSRLEAELVDANQAAAAQQGAEQGAGQGAQPGEAVAAAAEEFDEAVWNAYLTRWRGQWDGIEESWPGFKESFLYWAPAGATQAAHQLVETAEMAGLLETLTPYGIPAAGTVPAAQSAEDPQSEAAISAVLEEHPEFAALGTKRLQELFAEAAAELQASR